jgi:hypothetical protein
VLGCGIGSSLPGGSAPRCVAQLGGEALFQLADGAGVDVLQADAACLVQRRGTDLFEELLDHHADPHHLGGRLHHVCGGRAALRGDHFELLILG